MLSDIVHTYGSKILLIVLGLISNILITRSLGVAEYGNFVFAMTIVTMGMQFGSFGLHSANVYYAAKNTRLAGILLGNSLFFSLVFGVIVASIIIVVYLIYPAIFGIDKWLFAIAMAMIPFSLMSLYVRNILIGIGKIKIDNNTTIYNKVLLVGLLSFFIYFFTINVLSALMIAFVTLVAGIIIVFLELQKNIIYPKKISLRLLKKISGFGFKAYLSGLLAYLVFKSDLFFVNYFLSKNELSYYALAVGFVDYIFILPITVGIILFQKLSLMKKNKEKYELMHKATLAFGSIYMVFLFCIYLVSDDVITMIYGEEFRASVELVNLLLIAIFFMGLSTIFQQYIATSGFSIILIYAWGASFLLNFILNIIFIQRYGLYAVAVSTIFSYMLVALLSILIIKKDANEL